MDVFFTNPLPNAEEPFLQGRLATPMIEDASELEVTPSSGGPALKLPRSSVFQRSPPTGDAAGVPDNAQLFYLDEANLLHNVSDRYAVDEIYTYTGTVLLALNPYQALPKLYGEATMDSYRGRALGVRPPHVYGIAERARRMLVSEKADQSIIVSGEVRRAMSARSPLPSIRHSVRAEDDLLLASCPSLRRTCRRLPCPTTLHALSRPPSPLPDHPPQSHRPFQSSSPPLAPLRLHLAVHPTAHAVPSLHIRVAERRGKDGELPCGCAIPRVPLTPRDGRAECRHPRRQPGAGGVWEL